MSAPFKLVSDFEACGDQPQAIDGMCETLARKEKDTVLLGITGSGKTFTMANVIARTQRPSLILAHNKTLAAQLYGEFKDLFPENAVHYYVSYYDYYQPEAYVPASDTYIAKDSSINEEIDRMRHAATHALLTRRDVVVVASVSCIFGIGSSDWYGAMSVTIEKGEQIDRDHVLHKLVDIQYRRNDDDFSRGTFRVRGDVVEIFPVYEEDRAIRVEWFGDEIEAISEVDPLRGKILRSLDRMMIHPGSHYVTPADRMTRALDGIKAELKVRLSEFKEELKLVEAQRLKERTMLDIEMLEQMGYCPGIENYSRHLSGREPGEPPPTLLDYFPEDFLIFVDESHQTVPQLGAMYRSDRSRKQTLVDYGFRLPSALDNRPLRFEEFMERVNQLVYVSATPGDFELQRTKGVVVEQIVRPTGLLDPDIEVRPTANQVDDLLSAIKDRVAEGERVLVTTLTKRMAEDLTDHYQELGLKVRYLHSDVDTLDRIEIIRDLRRGVFDVLIGINLLREGLDLPEVSLVAILDADKEGFLRTERSLIQTCGRAARNIKGHVIMYAENTTAAMEAAIGETARRRKLQREYNEKHNITPRTVQRSIMDLSGSPLDADYTTVAVETDTRFADWDLGKLRKEIARVRKEMHQAARALEFERAAELRDQLKAYQERELSVMG